MQPHSHWRSNVASATLAPTARGDAMAKIVEHYPHKIREIETLWIPGADGTRLAARMWIPADAERNKVPAILEYIPYRRRDGTRARDAAMHPYIAGHGYDCI